jgi:hypothetical protein
MQRASLMSIALLMLAGILLGGMAAWAAPAGQEPEPKVDVWMSTTAGGGPVLRFPAGTTNVYAVMHYANFNNTTVQVTLRDDLGVTLFQTTNTYSYTDTRTLFNVTGDQVFVAYWDHINDHAAEMKFQIDQALITDTRKITTTVQAAMSEATLVSAGLQGVRRFSLPSTTYGHIDQARAALSRLLDHGTEATTAGKSLEQIRALVQQMQQEALTALGEIRQAQYGTRAGNFQTYLPVIVKRQSAGTVQPPNRALPQTPGCDQNLDPQAFTTYLDIMNGQGQFLPKASIDWIVGNPGSAAHVELLARPSSVYIQSVNLPSASHTSLITATVRDARCIPVQDGVQVSFTTTDPALGTVRPPTAPTFTDSQGRAGLAVTRLDAGNSLGSGFVSVTATVGSAVGARLVTLIGGPKSIQVSPTNRYLRVTTGDATRVVAVVRDDFNRDVADGTQVTFSVNPADAGFLSRTTVTTTNGTASTFLSPLNRRGPATVVAAAGTVTGFAEIAVVGPAHVVTVTAVPDTIWIGSPAALSDIHIQAVDDAGFPAPDDTEFQLEIFDPLLGYFEEGIAPERSRIKLPIRLGQATARLLPQPAGLTGSIGIGAQGVVDPVENETTVTVARSPMTVTVTAAPSSIATGGQVSTITARVLDIKGEPVIDGMQVVFRTTLGTVDPITTTTSGGTATTRLTSGSTTGLATVTATAGTSLSGVASGNTTVTITGGSAAPVAVGLKPTAKLKH